MTELSAAHRSMRDKAFSAAHRSIGDKAFSATHRGEQNVTKLTTLDDG